MKLKKALKYTTYFLIAILIIVYGTLYFGSRYYKKGFFKAGPNQMTINRNDGPFKFKWYDSYVDSLHYEPHTAIYFPVHIDGVEEELYMQWDNGAIGTIFYQSALFSLFQDDNLPDTLQGKSRNYLKDFKFSIGDHIDVETKKSWLLDYGSPSIDLKDTTTLHVIGTVGSDFIDGYIFSMNFSTQEVFLSDERNDFANIDFVPFEYVGRRCLFPAEIDNAKGLLYYDSGTSAFGILTTWSKFNDYADTDAEDIIYDGNSWGDKFACHNKSSSMPIRMGGEVVKMNRVSYLNWRKGVQGFLASISDINGMLGNKALLKTNLIIDTKNAEFAIINVEE